jgi:tetrahydromethanopterin S-methyltransferase subunit F
MTSWLTSAATGLLARLQAERGAIGALIIGIIIGAVAIVVLIIKFLIPGD